MRRHKQFFAIFDQTSDAGGGLYGRWRQCSLATQFTVVAALVVGLSMAILGRWVASRIESGVITNMATSAALYMDRFIEPSVQDLADGALLSVSSQAALTDTIKARGFAQQVIDVKIWSTDGTLVFSTAGGDMVGKRLPLSGSLRQALDGTVAAEFDDLHHPENVTERHLGKPLLEIYSPVRERSTERIIAVAEIYQAGDPLARELARAQVETVLMVCGLGLFLLGALSGIVRKGSRTIVAQQAALNDQIGKLSRSLAANAELSERLADANHRASESGERFLRRIGAELHDGPAQLIGLALLRLDGAFATDGNYETRARQTLEIIRSALKDALSEIRGLSHGLALPELENLSLEDALDLAISNHERRSGTAVEVSFPPAFPDVPASVKTCAYRFVQEGLNNAFRHAGGKGQQVSLRWEDHILLIEVNDEGPGINEVQPRSREGGMGLAAMRDRIESLGGSMLIRSAEGEGTRLQASFRLGEETGGKCSSVSA